MSLSNRSSLVFAAALGLVISLLGTAPAIAQGPTSVQASGNEDLQAEVPGPVRLEVAVDAAALPQGADGVLDMALTSDGDPLVPGGLEVAVGDGDAVSVDVADDGTFQVPVGDGLRAQPLEVVLELTLPAGSHELTVQVAVDGRLVRTAGDSRFATAAALSQLVTAPADRVYVARADAFPDALAGGPAAAADGAPILLLHSDADLPAESVAELQRLTPRQIVILGGQGAISAAVEAQLAGYARDVDEPVIRLAGADRIATAAAIALASSTAPVDVAYIATAADFPDALAGAAAAGAQGAPVLLTDGAALSQATADALQALAPARIVVLGGTAVVSDDVVTALQSLTDGAVDRLAGGDRYATAAAISAATYTPPVEEVFVAIGDDFPDALAAAAIAGERGAPLLLVPRGGPIPAAIAAELERLQPAMIRVIGGEAAISAALAAQLAAYATGGSQPIGDLAVIPLIVEDPATPPAEEPTEEPTSPPVGGGGGGGGGGTGGGGTPPDTNVAPTLDPVGDQASDEGAVVELQVVASDADGDVLEYAATGLPGGLSIDSATGVISGTIAQDAAANSPYSVTVTVSDPLGEEDSTSFAWTVTAVEVPVASAIVEIDPGDSIDASTFNGGLIITNTGETTIESVSFDLSTAILPDMVFDPVGTAGDATGLCLTPISGEAATGFTAPGDPCTDPFSQPHDDDAADGYDVVTVTFTDFDPDESFEFSVDIDPTSIKDAGSTGNAGSVSGLELIGSTITVDFGAGDVVAELFRKGTSNGASTTVVQAAQPPAPSGIDVVGVDLQPTTLSDDHLAAEVEEAAQTITVSGPEGATVSLLQIDAALVQMPGYDVEAFEANKAVAVTEYQAVIGAGGTVDIPVTLTDTAQEEDPNQSGLNHFVAVIEDDGITGPNSNVIILHLTPVEVGQATVEIDPGDSIDASTFGGGLTITNDGAVPIESVSFDLSTAFMPDMVFDPVGSAGDAVGKCLDPLAGENETGYQTPSDPCADPFSQPHDGDAGDGYDVATVAFDDFGSGETFEFAVDIDPTSIQGATGSGDAGSVSGLELIGSTITVEFADGTVVSELYRKGTSNGASTVVAQPVQPVQPTIDAVGVTLAGTTLSSGATAASVTEPGQTIQVAGPVGAAVSLLQVDASLVQMPGYDVEAFEANKAVAVTEYDAVIGAGGTVDIPVILTDTAQEDDPNQSGLNHFVAVIEDAGTTGPNSNVIVLHLTPPNQPPVAVDDVATVEVGSSVDIDVLANDSDDDGQIDPTTVTVTSGPTGGTTGVDPVSGVVTYNAEQGFEDAGGDSFTYTVADEDGAVSNEATVTISPPGDTVSLYRINSGGPDYTDTQGNLWQADAFFTGGQTYATTEPIDGTADDVLYQTERYGSGPSGQPLSYAFPVDGPGTYTVDLHMAEIFIGVAGGGGADDGVGDRIFDVIIEGQTVLADYDLFADVGSLTATIHSFEVPVTDGTIDITFEVAQDNAKVSAIEILGGGAAAGSQLVAAPSSVDFALEADATDQEDVVLTNAASSADPIEITDVALTGDDAFSVSAPTTPVTLQPGESADPLAVTVDTTGVDPGALQAILTITHDGDSSPLEVPLTATVTAPPAGGEVLHRVNAGGPLVAAVDGGPDWAADTTADPSAFLVNAGSNTSSNHGAVGSLDPSVPATTPSAVFTTERWDNTTDAAGEMAWAFPVAAGTQVEVRLYFRNGFGGTDQVGERVFDVVLDGSTVLEGYDIVADVGHDVGTVKAFSVVSDGTVDLEFLHAVENPLVNAIEIVVDEPQPNLLGASPSSVDLGAVLIGSSAATTVTLTNLGATGDPDITGTAVTVTGDADGEFTATLDGDTTIAPGESRTVDVTFSPDDAGAESAALEITHSGDNSPTTVPITGDGVSDIPVGFSTSGLAGVDLSNPTSIEFGPDGRLYASQQNGMLYAYTIERAGPDDYDVTDVEPIDLIQDIPNHDDDGSPNPGITTRQVTGLMTAGTAANPVLYVTSSDPRIGGAGGGTDLGLDTNSGIISRLTWTGSAWDHVQLVRGLPRSEENHSTNGLDLDPTTNTLYVMSGGHANKGAPSNNFAGTSEYYLSAAMLSVDLDALEAMTIQTDEDIDYIHDLPTLDDPTRDDAATDPFGGNDGLNQAFTAPGLPVQIHSPGYRNAYDVVRTESGRIYTWDNGPNTGWGGLPIIYGSDDAQKGDESQAGVEFDAAAGDYCTNEFNENGSSGHGDALHLVDAAGYYGGHPTPIRAFPGQAGVIVYEDTGSGWVEVVRHDFLDLLPAGYDATDFADNPVECDYTADDPAQYLEIIGSSTNGLTEYTASNFGGAMAGDLLAASFNGNIYRGQLNAAGDAITEGGTLFSGFGSTPLDVTAQGDDGPFPGTVWAATYGSDDIVVFEPDDYDGTGGGGGTCTGADDPALDEDGDGYDNADEIAAGTDPCNGGSRPTDFDGDGTSDVTDPDDDGDGIPDTDDPFAIDPANGMGTDLPVRYPLENEDPGTGFFGLGFTGLMTNGTDTWIDQFDEGNLTAGGAVGALTIDAVSAGDAYTSTNTQENAFQFGVNVDATTGPFVVHTQLEAPFFSSDGGTTQTPDDYQSNGVYIGTGTQDDYLKLVFGGNGGPMTQVLLETGGTIPSGGDDKYDTSVTGDFLAANQVDLYLEVDPATATVQPRISLDSGTTIVDLGTPVAVPASWFDTSDGIGLAVGIIATSNGPGDPFTATWDFLDVVPVDDAPTTAVQRINVGGPAVATIDDGPDWEADDPAHPHLAVVSGSLVGGFPVPGRDGSVPAYVPQALFQTERYDPTNGSAPDDLTYELPVEARATVTLNLLFANGWPGTEEPGERQFDVLVEGVVVLDELDLSATYGHATGGMWSQSVTDDGDGMITVVLEHGSGPQNPLLNGIEVIPQP